MNTEINFEFTIFQFWTQVHLSTFCVRTVPVVTVRNSNSSETCDVPEASAAPNAQLSTIDNPRMRLREPITATCNDYYSYQIPAGISKTKEFLCSDAGGSAVVTIDEFCYGKWRSSPRTPVRKLSRTDQAILTHIPLIITHCSRVPRVSAPV